MNAAWYVLRESFRAEILHLVRAPLFVALTVIQAITFLFLVSLFGLTGSYAPTAIITQDRGPYAQAFIKQLMAAHHSFDLRTMDRAAALTALHQGALVAIITLPDDFSDAIAHGRVVTLHVDVDNVNTDMTDDIQRALPSAIVAFGRQYHLPGIRLQATEIDLIDHDTGFIPYLVVSGLALDAFVIASILSAMAVAREFEARTVKLLAVAPVHPLVSLSGHMLATDAVACVAMLVPLAIVLFGYGIFPLHPLEMVGVMLLSIVAFGCIGVTIGTLLRRTLPVVSLIFGLGFPFYLCSGSLEPQRFDGNLIWLVAHISPVYYAVGILEEAFHGLQVTPEPQWVNFSALLGWALLMVLLAMVLLRTTLTEKTTVPGVPRRRLRFASARQWLSPTAVRIALGLLIALVVLGIGGELWLQVQQQRMAAIQQQQLQQQQARSASENQREDRLLNDYIQRTSALVAQNPQLYTQRNTAVRATIATLTQEVLRALNPTHKAALLRYLAKERFIDDDYQVVSLRGTDFRGCNLVGIDLNDTDLSGADFSNADMHKSKLRSSTLIGVSFKNTSLVDTDLKVADMHRTDIANANLKGADLLGSVGVSNQELLQAYSLAGTRLPDGSIQPGEQLDTDD